MIRRTNAADENIIEIFLAGVRAFGTRAADAYMADLKKLLELLERYPRMARLRPEFKPRIRVYPFNAHIVLYRQIADGIEVLRVLDGGRDWQRHLEDF